MLTISAIETPQPRSRVRRLCFIEISETLSTNATIVNALDLKPASRFEDLDELEEKIEEVALDATRVRAFSLLGVRNHSVAELIKKLTREGFPPHAIEEVVSYLVKNDYCNDAEYLKTLVVGGLESGMGPEKIKKKLMAKGFSRDLIQERLAELTDDEVLKHQKETAQALIARFDLKNRKEKEKAVRRLVTRGYRFTFIQDLIDELLEDN